jgi:hypothetical protein
LSPAVISNALSVSSQNGSTEILRWNDKQHGMDVERYHPDQMGISLLAYIDSYDRGATFQGDFEPAFSTGTKLAEHYTKAMHLLERLCAVEPRLLLVLTEMYCIASDCGIAEAVGVSSSDEKTEPPSTANKTESWTLTAFVKSKLKIIISELISRNANKVSALTIFQITSQTKHPQAKLILGHVLNSLLPQPNEVPKFELINAVLDYLKLLPSATDKFQEPTDNPANNDDGDAMDVDETHLLRPSSPVKPASLTLEQQTQILEANVQHLDPTSILLISYLLGGCPSSTVELYLPKIIKLRIDDMEALKALFQRVTKPIPPPLSKSQLLCFLLQMNLETHQIDDKAFIEVINICMNNRNDYNGRVLKETLEKLLAISAEKNVSTPMLFMRVAILAAQSFPEMKQYVLSTVIPAMVKRTAWATDIQGWRGVIHATKLFAVSGGVHAEAALKALLTLPFQQLLNLVKVVNTINGSLAKILKSMPIEDREALVRITVDTNTGSSSKIDKDKEKLLRDLQDGKLTVAAAPVNT